MNRVLLSVFIMILSATANGQTSGILGDWTNPSGSTIQIYRCGSEICAKLIAISKDAPGRVDAENPDPALRGRSLCGLVIGKDFESVSPSRAQGGKLYDPKSGKTYTGSMTREGDKLKLRGYVGIPLFGRTETWSRARDNIAACHS